MPHCPRRILRCACLLLLAALPAIAAPPEAEVRALLRQGQVDAAVSAAEALVERSAADANAWWWAGRAFGMKALRASLLAKPRWAGRTREAFERAVALDGKHLQARIDLMGYYLAAPAMLGGGIDKARTQASEIARIDAAMGKFAQASVARADDRPEEAAKLLQEALTLDPDALPVRMALAQRAQEAKDWAGVRAIWEGQLARERHQATARYQLGRAAAISGEELAQGLQYMDQFIDAGEIPEDLSLAAAHWRRGQILVQLGQREQGRAALGLAVDDPNVGELAREDLERLDDQ